MSRVLAFPSDHAAKARGRRSATRPASSATTLEREELTTFDAFDEPKPGAFGRGVWLAPWIGPNGETVLLVVTERKRLLCDPVTVPLTVAARTIADELFQRLDDASATTLAVVK